MAHFGTAREHPVRVVTLPRFQRGTWSRPINLSQRLFFSHAVVFLFGSAVLGIAFVVLLLNSTPDYLPGITPLPAVATEVSLLREQGASTSAIAQVLAQQTDDPTVRMVVLDGAGRVLLDTQSASKVLPWERFQHPNSATGTVSVVDDTGRVWVGTVGVSVGTATTTTVIAVRQGPAIRQALSQVLQPLLLATLLAMVLAGVVGAVLARSLVRPLRDIAQGMASIALGRSGATLQIKRSDEVGDLCAVFNDMSTSLHQSDKALREVLGNITHDLHTPLTAIAGWAEVLTPPAHPDEALTARAAEAIEEEARRMAGLINSMLLLSRMDGGSLPLQPDDIDVCTLLTSAVQRAADPARCRVLAPNSLRVRVDVRQFARVLDNLVANALRYSLEPGSIELGAGQVHDNGPVQLWVADQGPGIPVEDRELVFERFFQGGDVRPSGSAGLGLTIARKIVEAHGGTIVVEQNSPRGARFVISFGVVLPTSNLVTP